MNDKELIIKVLEGLGLKYREVMKAKSNPFSHIVVVVDTPDYFCPQTEYYISFENNKLIEIK